jgi:hypothetical protein
MARRPKGRVQVNDPLRRLPEERVRPLAPDVFVGAPSVSGAGAGLRDLADALSGFAGTVGSLEKVFEARKKEDNKDAYRKWSIGDVDYRRETLAKGHLEDGTPIGQNSLIKVQSGIELATADADALEKQIVEGGVDLASDELNIDTEVANFAQPTADRLKQADADTFRGYADEIARRRDRLVEQQTDARIKRGIAETRDKTLGLFQTAHKRHLDAGVDTDTKYKEITQLRNDLIAGPAAVGLPKEDVDDIMLGYVEASIEDDPELARRLLTEPRTGPNGEVVGPIAGIEKNWQKAEVMLRKIMEAKKVQDKATVTGGLTEEQLVRGLKGQRVSDMGDFKGTYANGEPFTITQEEQRKSLFGAWKNRSAVVAEQTKERPETTLAREVQELSRMGLKNEEWSSRFKALPGQLTEQNMQDPEVQQDILKTFQIYRSGMKASPRFMQSHLDKQTQDLLDLARVARDRGIVGSDDQALLAASRALDPNNEGNFEAVTSTVRKMVEGEYNNGGTYAREVIQTANAYVKLGGMGAKEAVELAKARVDEAGLDINGSFVEIPRDPVSGQPMVLPEDFEDVAYDVLEKWYDKHGDTSSYKLTDLTLQSSPNGTFMIVDKTGQPVTGINIGDAAMASPVLPMSAFMMEKERKDVRAANANTRWDVAEQNIEQLINADKMGYMDSVLKLLSTVNEKDQTLGHSMAAHATVLGKMAKKGWRAITPSSGPMDRGRWKLPGETK